MFHFPPEMLVPKLWIQLFFFFFFSAEFLVTFLEGKLFQRPLRKYAGRR